MEIIRADERGYFDHGWLKTFHTFSFADYYNPERMHFGLLRVLNDDVVEGHNGFGLHSHQNMEIISIPLAGRLEHQDSTGKKGIIQSGEVQVMSAGTGIQHSEKNPVSEPVNFLQIWIFPDKKDVEPRYEQKRFDDLGWMNSIQLLVSPNSAEGSLWIHQNAFLSRINITNQAPFTYNRFRSENGVYIFVLEGSMAVDNIVLNRRDSLLVIPGEKLDILPGKEVQLLFIEVPMS